MRWIATLALGFVVAACAAATDFDRYASQPEAAPDGPEFVQAGSAHSKGAISATIEPTKAGNLLVVMIANENHGQGPVKSISDDAHNVYESANARSTATACDVSSEIWFAKDIQAGATSVTVTMSDRGQEAEIWIVEASGLSKSEPLDKVGVANEGAKTEALAAPTVSPTSPRALVVSTACSCEEITGIQRGNEFKNLDILEGEGSAWFISDGAGTYGAVWNATPAGAFNASTASFKP